MSTVIIFAGGQTPPASILEDLPEAALHVAANGGFLVATALGQQVDVVVGDLDSVDHLPYHVRVHRHPTDKDATDLELALDLVVADHPTRIVVVGGSGGRHDHESATAGLLCAPKYAEVEEIDWISARSRAYVIRGNRRLHSDIGDTISLIPMGGTAKGVTTTGLHWNLDHDDLPSGSTRGVSNLFQRPVAEIRTESGVLLAIIPVVD